MQVVQPFPKRQIFSLFQTDDNFQVDENRRKFSNRVENTEGKGEIARNFSFSHSVFKRFVLQTRKNRGLIGRGLKLWVPPGWLSGERVGLMTWWL